MQWGEVYIFALMKVLQSGKHIPRLHCTDKTYSSSQCKGEGVALVSSPSGGGRGKGGYHFKCKGGGVEA